MKRVYLGNKELTALGVGGCGDDTQKWVDYFNRTLTEFTVPEGVTRLFDYTFAGNHSLTSITIPDSVTSIGRSTFNGCTSLTNLVIPDSITSIGTYAFRVCTSLTAVTIGNSVTSIEYEAFDGCKKLSTMTVKATTPPRLGDSAIPTTISTIYVPASSVNAYKSENGWRAFADKIQAIV